MRPKQNNTLWHLKASKKNSWENGPPHLQLIDVLYLVHHRSQDPNCQSGVVYPPQANDQAPFKEFTGILTILVSLGESLICLLSVHGSLADSCWHA